MKLEVFDMKKLNLGLFSEFTSQSIVPEKMLFLVGVDGDSNNINSVPVSKDQDTGTSYKVFSNKNVF